MVADRSGQQIRLQIGDYSPPLSSLTHLISGEPKRCITGTSGALEASSGTVRITAAPERNEMNGAPILERTTGGRKVNFSLELWEENEAVESSLSDDDMEGGFAKFMTTWIALQILDINTTAIPIPSEELHSPLHPYRVEVDML